MKQHTHLLALALLAAILLPACGNLHTKVVHESLWYMDAPIQRSNLMIYVKPQARHHKPLKALFFPLRMTQVIADPQLLGKQCGELMWNIWTAREVFNTLAYDEDLYMRSHRQAAAEARRRGADVAIVGYIPYFLSGGTTSDSAVSLKIQILDARTGETLVSMEESARLDYVIEDDYIFWVRRTRLPDSPIFVAVSAIAEDMALPVKNWSGGTYPGDGPGRPVMAAGEPETVSVLTPSSAEGAFEPAPLSEGLYTYAPEQQAPLETQLARVEGGAPAVVRLKVEFDFDKATIRKESYPLLDELGRALTSPALAGRSVVIKGHTDSDGSEEYNQKLSEERADSVKGYLAKHFGIDPTLIAVEAYGETRPLVPNTSDENKQINRRVEVQLAEKS